MRRLTIGDMNHFALVSKRLAGCGFDDKAPAVEIVFKNGTVHRYEGVTLEVYADFMASETKADFVEQHFAGRYPVTVFELRN